MTGKIRCNKCGSGITEKTRTCPKCGRMECHIALHWQGKLHRYYKDANGLDLSYITALDQLAAMNREMRAKTFSAVQWQPGAIKSRLIKHAATKWLEDKRNEVARNEMSYGSFHAYQSRIQNHILNPEYGLGQLDAWEIKYDDLEIFRDSLPTHLKLATRRAIMTLLHTFLVSARRRGPGMPEFPAVKGNDVGKIKILDIDDQMTALEKIPEAHRDVFEFEMETGIRPGETCSLKIKDFDFKHGTVTVCRTFTMARLRESDKEGHFATIPLSERALEIVKERTAGRFPDDWVFVAPNSRRGHYTVLRLWQIWKKNTGLSTKHYEATRHSFATQTLMANNGNVKLVQGLLRHATSKSTERYLHLQTEYLRQGLVNRTNVVAFKKKEGGA